MKYITIAILLSILFSCNPKNDSNKITLLGKRVDSLQQIVNKSYKPGFGQIMTTIQAHHAKLWFAGINDNWKLADFEVHELIEGVDDIKLYQKQRKESEFIDMINPALDSIKTAINNKNTGLFKESYTGLTEACNRCHLATDFEFNVVTIPEKQTFSNQKFKLANRTQVKK